MLVRPRSLASGALPAIESRYVSKDQLFLSPDKNYEVHAVSVYDGIAFLQIVDDKDTPVFLPRPLFEMVESSIPTDWICNVFAEGPVQLVMGPAYVAESLESYDAMVDQRRKQVESFWRRIASRAANPRNEDLSKST
jgi:hypothetical protein